HVVDDLSFARNRRAGRTFVGPLFSRPIDQRFRRRPRAPLLSPRCVLRNVLDGTGSSNTLFDERTKFSAVLCGTRDGRMRNLVLSALALLLVAGCNARARNGGGGNGGSGGGGGGSD